MVSTELVIVVPCYNEQEVLHETTRQLSAIVEKMDQDGKISRGAVLYVDDGSKDATWEIV